MIICKYYSQLITFTLPVKQTVNFFRWDHLSELLRKILSERPRNIGDTFEEFSLKVREARFRDKTDHLRDVYVPPEDYEQSQKLITLIQVSC